MNFELLLIMQIRKKGGMKFKKKSSLKLLSQSQPNFAEMILGWSSSKIVSSISELRPRWPPQPKLFNIGPYGKFLEKSSCLKPFAQ
jgi:hypothetical protein